MSLVLNDFASRFSKCWLCGVLAANTWPPHLEIHHIVRGQNRAKVAEKECCLIRTCQRCHQERLDSMPIDKQLALVFLNNPAAYNRMAVNQLRQRADDAITADEVRIAVREMEQSFQNGRCPFPRWKFG